MIEIPGYSTYTNSIVQKDQTVFGLVRNTVNGEKFLAIIGDSTGFIGKSLPETNITLCQTNQENAAGLQNSFLWLNPKCLGTKKSAGFGDRLGIATPGHIRAVKNTGIAPIFAQQSVRENARTQRSPQNVMVDAVWGIFQEGWKAEWGADADHLKNEDQVDPFIQAGYTFFTIDPGDFVDDSASNDSAGALKEKFAKLISRNNLPGDWWNVLTNRYQGTGVPVGSQPLLFDDLTLMRCAVKYGAAIRHVTSLYGYIKTKMQNRPFELEISVDETNTPTSLQEHYFIANELKLSSVEWISLAPRFTGRFEKGVDYIGSLIEFENLLQSHVEIARHFGSYKLSLHSGSDKFSLYPIVAKHTEGLYHLKTAGTSYLEALRVIAQTEPELFDAILNSARERYEVDKKSYHVSANLANIPANTQNSVLYRQDLLDQFDARQVLHVTFGSILAEYKSSIMKTLSENEEQYYQVLVTHFRKHLDPLIGNCIFNEKNG